MAVQQGPDENGSGSKMHQHTDNSHAPTASCFLTVSLFLFDIHFFLMFIFPRSCTRSQFFDKISFLAFAEL